MTSFSLVVLSSYLAKSFLGEVGVTKVCCLQLSKVFSFIFMYDYTCTLILKGIISSEH